MSSAWDLSPIWARCACGFQAVCSEGEPHGGVLPVWLIDVSGHYGSVVAELVTADVSLFLCSWDVVL